jgi:hypothetical protein
MATVRRIDVELKTGTAADAGTNGQVFLGLGGREFNLDLPGGDREKGQVDTYRLGDTANILNKERNDPREGGGYPLKMEDLFNFPVYLRFQGNDQNDDWNLESVTVKVTSSDPDDEFGPELTWQRLVGPEFNLWLGSKSGNICHLNPR